MRKKHLKFTDEVIETSMTEEESVSSLSVKSFAET